MAGGEILEKVVERLFGEVAGFAWLFFVLIVLCSAMGAEGVFGVIMAFILSVLVFLPSKLLDRLFDWLYRPDPRFGLRRPSPPHPGATAPTISSNDPTDFSLVLERTFATNSDFETLARENQESAPRSRFAQNWTHFPFGRQHLDSSRKKVAKKLGQQLNYQNFPFYKSCESIVRPTEKWSRVYSWIQVSKVARAFILPLFLMAVVDFIVYLFKWIEGLAKTYSSIEPATLIGKGIGAISTTALFITHHIKELTITVSDWVVANIVYYIEALINSVSAWSSNIEHHIKECIIAVASNWLAALGLCCLATGIYLAARIHSIRALYNEAANAEWVCAPKLKDRPGRPPRPPSVFKRLFSSHSRKPRPAAGIP
jgi:hypothetical protein